MEWLLISAERTLKKKYTNKFLKFSKKTFNAWISLIVFGYCFGIKMIK